MANPMAYRRAIILVSLLSLASAKVDVWEEIVDFFNGTATSAPPSTSLGPSNVSSDGSSSSSDGGEAGNHSKTEAKESTEASTTTIITTSTETTTTNTTNTATAESPVSEVETETTEAVAAGATNLTLADTSGMAAGGVLTITGGGNTETKTITSVTSDSRRLIESSRRLASGTVALDSPLQHAFPAGSSVQGSTTTETEDAGSSDALTLVWVLLGVLLVCCCIVAIGFACMRKDSGSSKKKAKKSIKKGSPVAPASSREAADALDKEETQPLMAVTATPRPSDRPPMYVQPQPSVQPIYMPTYAPPAGQPFSVKTYPLPQEAPPQDMRMAQFLPSAYPPASVV
mmetsp:Transcript_108998/g.170382  ORF Transcript_108998/g.170382 Transcript_108998/m.170382 type:complete len:344 (+) Transcript_108998:50-1081(+)